MSLLEPIEHLVQRLDRVRWRSKPLTREAKAFVEEHLNLVRPVVRHLRSTQDLDVVHAYGRTQFAGSESPEYDHANAVRFEVGHLVGSGVREAIIVNISSTYGWDHDPELAGFANPWLPILKLYELGYTTSVEDDPDGNWARLCVGHKGGIEPYDIIQAPVTWDSGWGPNVQY